MNNRFDSRASAAWRRRGLGVVGAAALLLAAACGGVEGGGGGGGGGGGEEEYPTKAVEMVVPFAAGGSSDLIGRAIAEAMKEPLGQSVVVTNKPGANGALGGKEVAASTPDGYRIVLLPSSLFAITPLAVQDESPLTLDDLSIIRGLTTEEVILFTHADSPFKTLEDVVARKDSGQPVTYGVTGVGTASQLAQVLFYKQAGVPVSEVPFDGGGPLVTAVLGQQVDLGGAQIAEVISQVEAGKLRILAVASEERSEFIPDVPTYKEKGFDVVVQQKRFLAGPKGLPENVLSTLQDAVETAQKDSEYGKFLEENYIARNEVDAEELKTDIETQKQTYSDAIQKYGITFAGSS
jgi:tripartite-type tricarboxylate transporter receptor subunit TctC